MASTGLPSQGFGSTNPFASTSSGMASAVGPFGPISTGYPVAGSFGGPVGDPIASSGTPSATSSSSSGSQEQPMGMMSPSYGRVQTENPMLPGYSVMTMKSTLSVKELHDQFTGLIQTYAPGSKLLIHACRDKRGHETEKNIVLADSRIFPEAEKLGYAFEPLRDNSKGRHEFQIRIPDRLKDASLASFRTRFLTDLLQYVCSCFGVNFQLVEPPVERTDGTAIGPFVVRFSDEVSTEAINAIMFSVRDYPWYSAPTSPEERKTRIHALWAFEKGSKKGPKKDKGSDDKSSKPKKTGSKKDSTKVEKAQTFNFGNGAVTLDQLRSLLSDGGAKKAPPKPREQGVTVPVDTLVALMRQANTGGDQDVRRSGGHRGQSRPQGRGRGRQDRDDY